MARKKDQELFVSTNPDLADSWGSTDLDFDIAYFLYFFGFLIFGLSNSQIPGFPNFQPGEGQAGGRTDGQAGMVTGFLRDVMVGSQSQTTCKSYDRYHIDRNKRFSGELGRVI